MWEREIREICELLRRDKHVCRRTGEFSFYLIIIVSKIHSQVGVFARRIIVPARFNFGEYRPSLVRKMWRGKEFEDVAHAMFRLTPGFGTFELFAAQARLVVIVFRLG